MCNQYMEYLNNYFGGKEIKPICREERQFALFLYNKLLNMVGKDYESIEDNDKDIYLKIFDLDKENIPDNTPKLLNVYYEVTFMRDFLEQEKLKYKGKNNQYLKNDMNGKKSFNHKLYDFTLKMFYDDKEKNGIFSSKLYSIYNNYENLKNYTVLPKINYGSKAKDNEDKNNKNNVLPIFIRKFMRAMMNSKPDIGLIYLDSVGKKHLKFLECKYLSPEGAVQLIDDKNNDKDNKTEYENIQYVLPQTVIQFFIADFICNYIMKGSGLVSDCPTVVNFVNSDSNSKTGKGNEEKDSISVDETDNNENTSCSDGSKGDKPIDKFNDGNIYTPEWYKEKIIGNQKSISISDLVPDCLKKQIFQIKD